MLFMHFILTRRDDELLEDVGCAIVLVASLLALTTGSKTSITGSTEREVHKRCSTPETGGMA
jgi:hypothetical protein